MGTKTIPQLTEVTSIDENALFPMDTGTQTRKVTLANMISSIEEIEKPTRTTFATSTYTILPGDRFVLVTGTTTVTLPAAADVEGQDFTIKNIDGSSGVTTVAFNGAETCDGLSTLSIPERYDFWKVLSDGTNWHIVGW